MQFFDEYEFIEELHRDSTFMTMRALCLRAKERVLVKMPISDWASPVVNLKLQEDYKLLNSIELYPLRRPRLLKQWGSRSVLIFNDFNGKSLSSMLQHGPFSLPLFFKVAYSLTQQVHELHQKNFVLRNLHPDYILFGEDTCQTQLINLDLTADTAEHSHISEASYYKYISPEQTGRINSRVDQRSDCYTLGIIFYQLLTGVLPFEGDALELVHAHMAKMPVDPSLMERSITPCISNMVLKLLEKSPDLRYQSSEDLLGALEVCEKLYAHTRQELSKSHQKPQAFPHTVSQKLYDRDLQMKQLNLCFQKERLKGKEIMMISGASGVGKTKLVQELQKMNRHNFVNAANAKFDVHKTSIPYSALITAFRLLMQKILTLEQVQLDYWKDRLIARLGENVNVIMDVIPELLMFFDSHEPLRSLPPEESQNRFNHAFSGFLSAMADPTHPLVLFLDDLHWADPASLTQLESFLLDDTIQGLLFIGTYRDTEITDSLNLAIQKISHKKSIHQLHLTPLGIETIQKMLSDSWQASTSEIEDIAALVYSKTHGNPFFVNQFLSSLNKEKYLHFDTNQGKWTWNSHKITLLNVSDNVIDFMVNKLQDLDTRTLDVLKAAACIGDEFGKNMLSQIAAYSHPDTIVQLAIAIQHQLIVPIHSEDEGSFAMAEDTHFKFAHDRVRQAVVSLLSDEETKMIRRKAGYYLLEEAERKDNLKEVIFSITDHLNHAASTITDSEQIKKLVFLNGLAGRKAKNANAYEAAIAYFSEAKKHLNFTEHYTQLFDYYLQSAECEYLNGEYHKSEQSLNYALGKARTKLDKLEVYKNKCHLYTSSDDKVKAVIAGLEGLKLLNVNIPLGKVSVSALLIKELVQARLYLPAKKIQFVQHLPVMQAEDKVKAMELMLTLAPPAYQYDQKIFALLVLKMLNISLKYGITGVSSHGLLGYGMLLSALTGDYVTGKKLAEVALQLNVELKYTSIKWKLHLAYHNFVIHWTENIRHTFDDLLAIEHGALKDGDPIYAGYAIGTRLLKKYALGFPLDALKVEFEKYDLILEQRGDVETQHILKPHFEVIKFLTDDASGASRVHIDFFNDITFVEKARQHASFTVLAEYYIAKLMYSYMMGDLDAGMEALKSGEAYITYVNTRYEICIYHFYAALLLIRVHSKNKHQFWSAHKRAIRAHIEKLRLWSKHCPDNFEPLYLLVLAENHSLQGNHRAACLCYESAIESSIKYSFTNHLALAYELASNHYAAQQLFKIAQLYGSKAQESYTHWNAPAKVKQLQVPLQGRYAMPTYEMLPDTAYLMKAAATISNEVDMDSLCERLIKIVMENACADKGYFILNHEGTLLVKASYTVATDQVLMSSTLPAVTEVPMALLRYVERTKTTLMINKDQHGNAFDHDPYFAIHHPHSILCFPIIEKRELQGIFYLENTVAENIFTKAHLDSLSLLSGQISVSLSNAALRKAQEEHMLDIQKATLATQEKEKKRIAQDLHDEIGVNLSAIRLQVKRLKKKLDLSPEYQETAQHITEAIDATISTTRRIAHDLMPATLEKLGLTESLESLCQELDEISGIEVTFVNHCLQKPILDKAYQIQLYRIVKELFNNALKHAQATKINIILSEDQQQLKVKVEDDGIGFSVENSRKSGIGIRSIENRCCMIAADLQITSEKGRGTTVVVCINIPEWQL